MVSVPILPAGAVGPLNIARDEVAAMERVEGYKPSPATLRKLSEFYSVPLERLAALAGAEKDVPKDLRESASRFAARWQSLARLSGEEKRALDEFVEQLKGE